MKNSYALLVVALFAFLSALTGCAASVYGTRAPNEPDAETVADSGIVESDAAPVVDAGPQEDVQPDVVTRPHGHVTVVCGDPASASVLTDTNDFSGRTVTIQVQGRPVEVLQTDARIGWFGTGLDGFVAGEGGNFYFHDFKLRNTATGRIKQGPIELMLPSMSDRRTGVVRFTDTFTIEADTTRTLEFLFDVAAHEERYHTLTSRYYALLLGNGHSGVFGTGGLVYADTHEPVPPEDITYDASCSADPSSVQFQVTSRFADMIADLDRDKFARSEATITPGALYTIVPFFVLNEGAEDGIFSGTQIGVNARNNGVRLPFASFATVCFMTSMSGDVNYGAGVIRDDSVTFAGLNILVPGNDEVRLRVRCSYTWPATAVGNDVELRAGAYWDSFTMVSLRAMGRIVGTTVLQDNRLFEILSALQIILHLHG